MYVIDKIIEKTERSTVDWRRGSTGTREFPLKEYHKQDYRQVSGSTLAAEVRMLEQEELLHCKWYQKYSELDWFRYNLEDLPKFYQRAGRREKYLRLELLAEYLGNLEAELERPWIQGIIRDMREQIEAGKLPPELKAVDLYLQNSGSPVENWQEIAADSGYLNLFAVLCGLDKLETPVYKRIFSSSFLKDTVIGGKKIKASKVFEKSCEESIISFAKRFHPDVDENMDNTQILSQLGIEEYAQVLALKGPMKLELNGQIIDLAPFTCGAVLNSQTLTQANPVADTRIRKIITVENQANYEAMAYEPGTLIIFCHGYFTPRERLFLVKLRDCLSGQPVEYFHTGDLDYGGICIFRYNRRRIFPGLKPLYMDTEQYERYRQKAEPMEPETIKKLIELDEPLLQPLIALMAAEGMGIEQEQFVKPDYTD